MAGVTDGQDADETTFNSAYIFKNGDDTSSAKLGFSNADAESGPAFTSIQKEVNNKRFAPSNETIAGGGTISITDQVGMQTKRIISSGGTVTTSTTLFGTTDTEWVDGMEVRLMGEDDTDAVKVEFNDIDHGVIINGVATLTEGSVLTLQWHATKLRWIEISRNF